jgi:Major Facilitator Superfamily
VLGPSTFLKSKPQAPLRTLFSAQHAAALASNVLIIAGCGVGYYLTSGYMPTFLKLVKEVPNSTASLVLMAASLVTIVAQMSAGHLSEVIGRRRTFIVIGVVNIVALPAFYLLLARTNDVGMIALYSLALTFLANAAIGPAMVFLNEPSPRRCAQRDEPVLEPRIRAGRVGADFRVARQRLGRGTSDDARGVLRYRLPDLSNRRAGRAGNKGAIHLNNISGERLTCRQRASISPFFNSALQITESGRAPHRYADGTPLRRNSLPASQETKASSTRLGWALANATVPRCRRSGRGWSARGAGSSAPTPVRTGRSSRCERP